MEQDFIVIVRPNGLIEVKPGASIGQVLTALEVANKAILNIVLRPIQPEHSIEQLNNQTDISAELAAKINS